MRARSCCCGTVSSLTDVWDREPAYGSKSAEQHRAAARRSCFEGSHYRQNSLTAALPRRCTQPAEPVMPRECLFDGEGWWWAGAQCVLLEELVQQLRRVLGGR